MSDFGFSNIGNSGSIPSSNSSSQSISSSAPSINSFVPPSAASDLESNIRTIENNLKKKVMETKGLAANLEFYDFKVERFDLLNDNDIKRYEEFIKMSNQIGSKTSGVHVSSENTYMCEESSWTKKTVHPITIVKHCKYRQRIQN